MPSTLVKYLKILMPQKKHLHLSKCFVLLAPLVDYRSNRFMKYLKSLEMKKATQSASRFHHK